MRNYFYVILIFLFFAGSSYSQTKRRNYRQHEVGFLLGGAYYIGDLNPRKQFNQTQPGFGLFYRFAPNYRYAFRAGFNFGEVRGDDSQSEDADQLQRNLNFKSQIYEFNAIAEFNFLEYRISNDKYKFTTYLFLGLDVFQFKPQAQVGNYWTELQPLRTEGQSKPYKLVQMGIPFGIGAKINVSKKVGIGLEWGPRKLFTDYLDDVSGTYPDPENTPFLSTKAAFFSDRSKIAGSNVNKQRGNPRTKDWYVFFGLTLTIKLDGARKPCYAYDH